MVVSAALWPQNPLYAPFYTIHIFNIEILLPPRINRTAPTFIGTVPRRLMEKDLDLIVIHDDFLHEIVNEHLGFKSQGLLVVYP